MNLKKKNRFLKVDGCVCVFLIVHFRYKVVDLVLFINSALRKLHNTRF